MTEDELARLHPRTNRAVLERLLGLFADIDDPTIRTTLLEIAARGPEDEHTVMPSSVHRRPGTKRVNLTFLARESWQLVFFTDNEQINELLVQLFDPPAT